MKRGMGAFCPTEEPTTCLGRSSLYGLWGHQLLEGTPHASISVWTWAIRAWFTCLWVATWGQFMKHRPFMSHDKQASWSPPCLRHQWTSIPSVRLEHGLEGGEA
jgi:hypothetical protein